MTKSSKKLTPRQWKALDLMLAGLSLQEVAREVGVARQTISLWKNQSPEFKEQLEALMAEVVEELRHSAPAREAFMLSQLCKLASEGPHDTRLKAALAYLDRFCTRPSDASATAGLNEADAFILRVMQDRRTDQVSNTGSSTERSA